jgi:hypothetical protein
MAKGFSLESHSGLLVKVSKGVAGDVGGKRYFIPESALAQFLINPKNKRELDEALDGTLENIDYGIFRQDMTVGNSGG